MAARVVRFSLLSSLLVVGLICATASHIYVTREKQQLRAENDKLHEDLGHLTVRDADKVYVRQLETTGELTWQYRIYLPPKKKFMAMTRAGSVTSSFPFQ